MATPRKKPFIRKQLRTDLHVLKRELKYLTAEERESWLQRLGAVGEELRKWKAALVADLGGDPSTAELAIIELCTRSFLMLESVDKYLLSVPSLVNRQKHRLFNVVLERETLANSLARNLERLGLKRRAKALPSLQEYLASKREPESEAPPQGEASP